VSILPVQKSQSAVHQERSLKPIVDYSVSGQSVGAFVVPHCTPVFVFGWNVQGNQACASSPEN
jgi:hypothetical protein